MKKLLVLTLALTLAACGSTSNAKRDAKHANQIDHIAKTIEKSQMNGVAFCGKENFYRYMETDYYYNFVCKDGSNFMIKK